MGRQRHPQRVRDKYTFIKAHRNEFDIATMCRVLGVSRSGFYEWLRHPLSDRAREDQRLLALIRASYAASHGVYGAPRIFLDLREAGETCSKHRVTRLMRANKIKALYGYRSPRPLRGRTSQFVPNTLQRRITVVRPNQALGDRHHLRAHMGRLAVLGRGDGSLLTPNRRLVDQAHLGVRTRAGCGPDGGVAPKSKENADSF
jgi:putative transposase